MGRKPIEPDTSTFRGRFAANLRRLRERRYAYQDDFVDALRSNGLDGATKSTVSGWETGRRIPLIDHWPVIAETLRVRVRSLLPPE